MYEKFAQKFARFAEFVDRILKHPYTAVEDIGHRTNAAD